jgi:hypothetical protein
VQAGLIGVPGSGRCAPREIYRSLFIYSNVTVIDVRAGLLQSTLRALGDISFLDTAKDGQLTFIVFHVLGSSITSLDEIEETASLTTGGRYFLVKNFINDTGIRRVRSHISRNPGTPRRSQFQGYVKWPTNK